MSFIYMCICISIYQLLSLEISIHSQLTQISWNFPLQVCRLVVADIVKRVVDIVSLSKILMETSIHSYHF